MACSKCNRNGLYGLGNSAMFADDVVEESVVTQGPVYVKLPDPDVEAAAAALNPTAQLVTASLNAQAPTGGAPRIEVIGGNSKVLYFDEEGIEPYHMPEAPVAAPEPKKSGAGKVAVVGLGLYLAWKLLG